MKELIAIFIAKTDWMKTFVGISFVGIFLFTVVHVLKSEIPEGNREIAHFILGEVAGAALTIAAFYYGSSKGSQDKQDIIADQAKKNNA